MKKSVYSLFAIIFGFSALFALTSCENDDPSTSPLIGTWSAFEDNAGPIYSTDDIFNKFTFYSNGTGTYEYFNDRGEWRGESFKWTSMNNDWVELVYSDGERTNAYYRFSNGVLEFSQTQNFRIFTRYRSNSQTFPIIGTWSAWANNEGPIYTNDMNYDKFIFKADGTGRYEYFDARGNWVGTSYKWRSYNRNYVRLVYSDGVTKDAYYSIYDGYIRFSATSDFRYWTEYRSTARSGKSPKK